MKLLLVTDHRFFASGGAVYDTHCFGPSFFEDYLKVFESVNVLCRMSHIDTPPKNAFECESRGLRFIGLPDVRGAKWLVKAKGVSSLAIKENLAQCGAVIARVPSELGWHAASAARRMRKPFMIEVIGDPWIAAKSIGRTPFHTALGWFQARRLRRLAKESAVASYVNGNVLPNAYPVGKTGVFDTISSIRLPAGEIAEPRKFDVLPNPLRIVFVAGMIGYKRHSDLVLACRKVVDQGVAVELHFAGDGPSLESVRKHCDSVGLNDKVVFHGHIASSKKLASLLDSSHLFAIPSATEGLPRAVVEAMARGLPVIGSTAGGIPELVRPLDLFNVGDVDEIANLIRQISMSRSRLTTMSMHSISKSSEFVGRVLSPRRIKLYRLLREKAECAV